MESINSLYWFEENGVQNGDGDGHFAKYIIEQFTGLHDKNGKEIFEGDIVRYEPKKPTEHFLNFHKCGYEDSVISFSVQEDEVEGVEYIGLGLCHPCERCEVLGNIHENPDLLHD